MSLDISNILNTLKGFYDSQQQSGQRYTGTVENVESIVTAYGISGSVTDVSLTEDALSKEIFEDGQKITVTSENENKFSYKKTADNKIVIFGNNLTISVDEEFQDLIEVVGISNVINATKSNDNITLLGFDNQVNADDGDDTITVYGEDNLINGNDGDDEVSVNGDNNEIANDYGIDMISVNGNDNIFKTASGIEILNSKNGKITLTNTDENLSSKVEIDGNTYFVKINQSTQEVPEKVEIEYSFDEITGEITFAGNNFIVSADDGQIDNIKIVGEKNIVESGDESDKITLVGDSNIVHAGEGDDEILINGKSNRVYGDSDSDEVTVDGELNIVDAENAFYNTETGKINLAFDNSTAHYINATVDGITYKYLIERNETSDVEQKDIEAEYEIKDGQVIIKGNNLKIKSQNDFDEQIKIVGDKNYIDASDNNDEIEIDGNRNIIITGEGSNIINIDGEYNQVTGNENDKVFYTKTSGTVSLVPSDKASHIISVNGFSYSVKRNTPFDNEVVFSYELKNGVFEFEGSSFDITELIDGSVDKLKIKGSYVRVDVGDGNDEVTIEGNANIVHAGEGNDKVAAKGNNNQFYGDEGEDEIALDDGINNTYENFEYNERIITLTDDHPSAYYSFQGKTYSVERTKTASGEGKTVDVICRFRNGELSIEADDVIVYANSGQEDVINFKGNNSKIFAGDKNDIINVVGDGNYIDGWSGNDKITAIGLNNKAYGFLGDDEINIIQRENTEKEIEAEIENIDDEDSEGNVRTEEQKRQIAINNLTQSGRNFVDGEFDMDTVIASQPTKISVNTEIYKSLANTMRIRPSDDEKKIVVDGKSYTVKNYATAENNNPFVSTRDISYEVVDVEIDGEVQKQLVVKGDYISVVADDGQDDNVKVIGNHSYLDLSDGEDYLEAEGNSNMLFGGIGADTLKVVGNENVINADTSLLIKPKEGDKSVIIGEIKHMTSFKDDDNIIVIGNDNTIKGGDGVDTLNVDGTNAIWDDVEYITGVTLKRDVLTNETREAQITIEGDKVYTIKVNIPDDEEMTEDLQYSYSVKDVEIDGEIHKQLIVKGDNLHIVADDGQQDDIVVEGDNCVIELGDEDDIASVYGANNEIKGGKGDDKLTVYGTDSKVYGNEGDDEFEVHAVNTKVYALDDTIVNPTVAGDDKLIITGNGSNEHIGFAKDNVEKHPEKGIVAITDEEKVVKISYLNEDGKEVILKVEANVLEPQKLAGTIYVNYEIKDIEIEVEEDGEITTQTKKQIVIEGSDIRVVQTEKFGSGVVAKLIGSNIHFRTFDESDYVEVVGTGNNIDVGEGENTVIVNGDYNKVEAGENDASTITVVGDVNEVTSKNPDDEISLAGVNNQFFVSKFNERVGGTLALTKDLGAQTIVINDRAYEVSMYGIPEDEFETRVVPVSYVVDKDGYTTFTADNIMIRVIDSQITPTSDEVVTDNSDAIKLIGNNCYVFSGFGDDAIIVEGDNNTLDGWTGNDSFYVVGDNNKVIGFDGDDIINIKGNNNYIDGENGKDTVNIEEGTGNTYYSVEKIYKK